MTMLNLIETIRSHLETGKVKKDNALAALDEIEYKLYPPKEEIKRSASNIVPWKHVDIVTMKELAAQGHSAGYIGGHLGRSRNAIIGKCNRLGIKLLGGKQPAHPKTLKRTKIRQCQEIIGEPRNFIQCKKDATRGSYCEYHAAKNFKNE